MSSSLKPLEQFFIRFHMGPFVERILTICSKGSAPKKKRAAIYGKKHSKLFFSRTKKALKLNRSINYQGLKFYQVCSNDDRRLTFDLFTAWSNLRPHTFVWEKC